MHSPHYKSYSLKEPFFTTQSEKKRTVVMNDVDVTFRQETILGDFLIYTIETMKRDQAMEAP
jgi:hypothetical protein